MPSVIKAGGDGVYGASFLTGAGFPAAEGWYATIASPHLTGGDTKAAEFVKTFTATVRHGAGGLLHHRL